MVLLHYAGYKTTALCWICWSFPNWTLHNETAKLVRCILGYNVVDIDWCTTGFVMIGLVSSK